MTEITPVGHWTEDSDSIDVYIGRSGYNGQLRHFNNCAVWKRGWLGNPYTLDDHDRQESIAKFRGDFETALSNSEKLQHAVADLKGQTLGCWCRQLDEDFPDCHGDVIAEWADRLAGDHPDFPGHKLDRQSCPPGEHQMIRGEIPTRHVCSLCGLGETTLVDQLGHSPTSYAHREREEGEQ